MVTVVTAGRSWLGADVESGQSWYEATSNLLYKKDDQLDQGSAVAGMFIAGGREQKSFLLLAGRWEGFKSVARGEERHLLGSLIAWNPGWLADRQLVFATVASVYLVDPYVAGTPYFAGFVSFTWDDLLGEE